MSGLLGLFKGQGEGVDAVAQAVRRWAIVKDMAEVGMAMAAEHFRAYHVVAAIFLLGQLGCGHWLAEAGPAATGIELVTCVEQRLMAADAVIVSGFVMIPVGAGKGAFRSFFTGDVILRRCKQAAPFFVRADQLGHGTEGSVRSA